MNVNPTVFQKLLTELFLLLFGALLLYGDYLQEATVFSSTLNLNETKVDKAAFVRYRNLSNTTLLPPYPHIDLPYLAPVFLENGSLNLSCQTEFTAVKCRPEGTIPSTRIYLTAASFRYAQPETIRFQLGARDLAAVLGSVAKPSNNTRGLQLFENYLVLFGGRTGTAANLVSIMRYKWSNFVLFASALAFIYTLHLPLYLFLWLYPNEDDPDEILTSLPNLFDPEKGFDGYSREARIDTIRSRFQLGLGCCGAVVCLHFLVYYLIGYLLLRQTNALFEDPQTHTLSTFLFACRLVLNFVLSAFFHWLYVYFIYFYTRVT